MNLLGILLLCLAAYAGDPPAQKSAFEMELQKYGDYQTREKWVKIGETQYREVEYKNKKYYIKFTGRNGDFGELDCDRTPGANPSAAEGAVQVFNRTKLFVRFLEESCETDARGQRRVVYKLDPRLGFTIPDTPKSTLKNKKVFIQPGGAGFSGDF